MKKFRENMEIVSDAVDTSWLKFAKLNSVSPETVGAKHIGVDATGNVVIASSAAGNTSVVTNNNNWTYTHNDGAGVLEVINLREYRHWMR